MSENSKIKLLKEHLIQLSHKLRNSVSAADAVLGDKLSGFALTDDDFKDAKQALDRVKVLIDELDEVSDGLEG